jgi:hypothetical protein
LGDYLMSHNAQVINGVEPNVLSQYGEVSGRPLIIIGRGLSDVYSNSGAGGLGAGQNARFYDTAPINSISSATLNAASGGSSGWYESVTLPAGIYFIRAYFSILFSATGLLTSGLYNGSIFIGSQSNVGGTATSNSDGGGFASTTITLSTTTTISLRIVSSTNPSAVASQGTTPSQESWFLVEKLQ